MAGLDGAAMGLDDRVANYALAARRVATPDVILEDGFVVVEGGSVREVGRGLPPSGTAVVDLGDMLIVPGFIDVHVHGGGGAQVNCATREEVEASVRHMAAFHARHGTTALVATTVSDSPEALRAAVEGVAAVTRAPGDGSQPAPAGSSGTAARGPLSWAPTSRGHGSPGRGREPSTRDPAAPLRHRVRRPGQAVAGEPADRYSGAGAGGSPGPHCRRLLGRGGGLDRSHRCGPRHR